jgi:hypothetical protein
VLHVFARTVLDLKFSGGSQIAIQIDRHPTSTLRFERGLSASFTKNMSLFPIKDIDPEEGTGEERQYLLAALGPKSHPASPAIGYDDVEEAEQRRLAELIYTLFTQDHHHTHQHPRSSPRLPPVRRGERHRNYFIYQLNQFVSVHSSLRILLGDDDGLL